MFLSVVQKTIMFSIESGANNSFIQSHRSAVSTSSVCKVSSDLNHKPDAHLREANNFLEVARTLAFSDGRCCVKQRLNFCHPQNYEKKLSQCQKKLRENKTQTK